MSYSLQLLSVYLLTQGIERITGTKGRMFYTNFDDNITAKYGVIVKNWPLPVFRSPGDIRTVTELNVLYSAWDSGTAHFYKLTTAEAIEWLNERSKNSTAGGTCPPSPSLPSATPAVLTVVPASTPTSNQTEDQAASEQPTPHQPSPMDPADGSQNAHEPSPANGSQNAPEQMMPSGQHATPSDLTNVPMTPPSTLPAALQLEPAGTTTGSKKRALNTDTQPLAPSKRRRQGLAAAFVNTVVTSIDGTTIVMNTKSRKARSDKGKKRKQRT